MFTLFTFTTNTQPALPSGVAYKVYQIYSVDANNDISIIKSRDNASITNAQKLLASIPMNRNKYAVTFRLSYSDYVISAFEPNIATANRVDFYVECGSSYYKMNFFESPFIGSWNSSAAVHAENKAIWDSEVKRLQRIIFIDEILEFV